MYPTTFISKAKSNQHNKKLKLDWRLPEFEEKRIMNALSSSTTSYSEEEEEEEEGELESPTAATPRRTASFSYFSDRAIFQLQQNNQVRRVSSTINSLRCPTCQRRFHSQGNLSNHKQLYHY